MDQPASDSQDDPSVNQESPSIAGDNTKLLGGASYGHKLTEASHFQEVRDQDVHVRSAVKKHDDYRQCLEKEWKAISARIELKEAKLIPSSQHLSVTCALCFHFTNFSMSLLWLHVYLPLLSQFFSPILS